MNSTEKLIDLVKPHECLYFTKHKDFKNTEKKDIIWEKISKALNQSRKVTKYKWKNLKDSYTKHQKQVKGETGQQRNYVNWPWAPYLSFLDCTVERQPMSSNILKPAETPNCSEAHEDVKELTLLLEPIPPEKPQYPESPCTPNSETSPMRLEAQPRPTTITQQTAATSKKKKQSQDDVDKVINYLKNKKRNDEVDFLFNSYAETFRKLKPRTQAELKLKMAQIFTEAELTDLDYEQQHNTSIKTEQYFNTYTRI